MTLFQQKCVPGSIKIQNGIAESLLVSMILCLIAVLWYFSMQMTLDVMQAEVPGFLYHYTSARPFWSSIFDPAVNDWGMYQAREFSYIADYFDANFILISWVHGYYHLLSLSSVILLGATVFLQQFAFIRFFPDISRTERWLYSFLYIMLPSVTLDFFRSSKHLTAFFATALMVMLIDMFRRKLKITMQAGWMLFILLLLMSLSDRQGFFITGCSAGFAGLLCVYASVSDSSSFCRQTKDLYIITGICLAAFVLSTAYNLAIGPFLIHALNGYYPDFNYQHIPVKDMFQFSGFVNAGCFLFCNIGQSLTCITNLFWAETAGIAIVLLPVFFLLKKKGFRSFPFFLFIFVMLCMFICSLGMAVRHPAVAHQSVIYGLYFLPFASILFFFVIQIRNVFPVKIRILYIVLMLIGQIYARMELNNIPPIPQCTLLTGKFFPAMDSGESDFRKIPLHYRYRLLAERVYLRRSGRKIDYISAGSTE